MTSLIIAVALLGADLHAEMAAIAERAAVLAVVQSLDWQKINATAVQEPIKAEVSDCPSGQCDVSQPRGWFIFRRR